PSRGLNWFRNHLLWHLALLHFARGEYARASDIARATFEREPSSIAGDLHDSISLLWRLELVGQPVGARWEPFTAIARERVNRMGLLFHAAHVAMALVGGGDWTSAKTQLDAARARATRDPTGLMGDVLVPLIEGLHAFAQGDYRTSIARIEPLRPRIVEDGGRRGGMARLATLVKRMRAAHPNVVFAHAGDALSPSPMSTVLRGAQMIAVLNALGLDVATFGNHEFDFGPAVLRERVAESRFLWLSANVVERASGRPFGGAAREWLLERGGLRLGLFGLTTTEAASTSAAGPAVEFRDTEAEGKTVASD